MSAITIRKIPDDVHARLRALAAKERVSIESLAREALVSLVQDHRRGGIDLDEMDRRRIRLGVAEIGGDWIEEFDDPTWGRAIFGLDEDPNGSAP